MRVRMIRIDVAQHNENVVFVSSSFECFLVDECKCVCFVTNFSKDFPFLCTLQRGVKCSSLKRVLLSIVVLILLILLLLLGLLL